MLKPGRVFALALVGASGLWAGCGEDPAKPIAPFDAGGGRDVGSTPSSKTIVLLTGTIITPGPDDAAPDVRLGGGPLPSPG